MRPLIFSLGIVVLVVGVYPPFHLWTALLGLGATIFGIVSKNKEKR